MPPDSTNSMLLFFRSHKLLVTLVSTIVSICVVRWFNVSNPAIVCLIAVVYSTFWGGFRYGFISGFLTVLYCTYFFSSPENRFSYTPENLNKVIVIVFSTTIMIWLVGLLQQQVEKQTHELERINAELRLLSSMDGLTGISNRRHYEYLLEQEWRRAMRDKTPIALGLIDVDFFKNYNDTYGHQAGDDCLKQIALAIAKRIHRPCDFIARYGGEEFVVLMGTTNAGGAVKVLDEMRKIIEGLCIPNKASSISPWVSISAGVVSIVPTVDDNLDDFVKKADIALYHAKHCGRNQVQLYSEAFESFCME